MPDWLYPTEIHAITSGRHYSFPSHLGLDFLTPTGTMVVASREGTVTYLADETAGFGNVIVLTHPDGWRSLYAHLSAMFVVWGDSVPQGFAIGRSGGAAGAPGAGNSSGPHLHYQIMEPGVRNSERTVDPEPLLAPSEAMDPIHPPEPEPGGFLDVIVRITTPTGTAHVIDGAFYQSGVAVSRVDLDVSMTQAEFDEFISRLA